MASQHQSHHLITDNLFSLSAQLHKPHGDDHTPIQKLSINNDLPQQNIFTGHHSFNNLLEFNPPPLNLIQQNSLPQDLNQQVNLSINQTWHKNSLAFFSWITKFSQNLKIQNLTLKFKMITLKIMTIINDKSADFDYYFVNGYLYQNPSFYFKFKYQFRKYIKYLPCFTNFQLNININVISPGSSQLFYWNFIIIFLLIINIFYLPLYIVFDPVYNSGKYFFILNNIPTITMLIDSFFVLNTGFYLQGSLIKTRKEILYFYARKTLLSDIFCILSIYEVNWLLQLLSLIFKIMKLLKKLENWEEVAQFKEKASGYFDLLKLVLSVLIIAHICACSWRSTCYLSNYLQYKETWLNQYEIQEADWYREYILSLYWSIVTMLTIGYGDIIAVNDIERIFTIIMACVTCGVFGYTINAIGTIFQDIHKQDNIVNSQLRLVNNFMKKQNLDQNLQIEIKKYYQHYFKLQSNEQLSLQNFVLPLTENLQKNVMIALYKKQIEKSGFIKQFLSKECIESLCLNVEEKTYLPNQIIFEKNDQIDYLIFILEGTLQSFQQYKNGNEQALKIISSGSLIDEKDFIIGELRKYSLKSEGFSKILVLKKQEMINTIKKFPNDFEIYCMKKDFLQQFGYLSQIKENCQICEQIHSSNKCPFTFMIPSKAKTINSFNKTYSQSRMYQKRKTQKNNSLKQTIQIQTKCFEFILNNNILENFDQVLFDKLMGFDENDISAQRQDEINRQSPQSLLQVEEIGLMDQDLKLLKSKNSKTFYQSSIENNTLAIGSQLDFINKIVQVHKDHIQADSKTYQEKEEQSLLFDNQRDYFRKQNGQQKSVRGKTFISMKLKQSMIKHSTRNLLEQSQISFDIVNSYEIYQKKFNLDVIISKLNKESDHKKGKMNSMHYTTNRGLRLSMVPKTQKK